MNNPENAENRIMALRRSIIDGNRRVVCRRESWAVEDAYASSFGHVLLYAPKIAMVALLEGRPFEREHLAALWIDAPI